MRKKILLIFGTRPEAIKMAPLVKEFQKYPKKFDTKVCVTAQHREMLDQVLDFFEIKPDCDLDLMKPGQNLYGLTANIIESSKPILEEFNPDYVFVHGDTTTTMAGSIASFYSGSKVCHVEAGLRTNNKLSPFPEEINRQITGRISDYHFAPTKTSKKNLLVDQVNDAQKLVIAQKIVKRFGEDLTDFTFGIWGLAFKPGTDDMREAPAIYVIKELVSRGAQIKAYDPKAIDEAKEHYLKGVQNITYVASKYDVLKVSNALILLTEWKEFRSPDFEEIKAQLKTPVIFDGRNQYIAYDLEN